MQYVVKHNNGVMLFDHDPGMKYAVVVDKFVRGWTVWDLFKTEEEARSAKPYWDMVSSFSGFERRYYEPDEIQVVKIHGTVQPIN